jgi:hypothetical protein
MNTQEKIDILKQAKEVFFKALLAGYFSHSGDGNDSKIITVKSPNGTENIFRYTDGDFIVIDSYWATPNSDYSTGTTTILFRNYPIWWMSYGGHYPKEVIRFLKLAIEMQYKAGLFRGGRGPARYSDVQFTYKNISKGTGNESFSLFSGREEIWNNKDENLLGFHEYFGISML